MKAFIKILILFLAFSSAKATELVHFTLENRQVSGNDYLIDLYAEPSGTWRVGGCNIAIEFNSDGLSADEYNDDDILNIDSDLSNAGYNCTQQELNNTYVIVSLFTLSPSVDKTSKFKIGTIKLKILDNTEYDDLSFYPDESEVANNWTQLTYGCSQSSCWDATDPTTQVIGQEAGLDAPTLSSPSDESTDVSTSPTVSWNSVTGATNYDIQVSTVSDFSSTVVNDNVTNTSKSVSGLNYSTTYYWRARAKNTSETSAWSSVWSFTTESQALSAPTLSSPSDEATDVSTSPTVSWNSVTGATNYDIQVSTVNDFSSTVVNDNVTSTSKSVSGLNYSTTYYWRARAKNSSETSNWSSVWSFTTESSGGSGELVHFTLENRQVSGNDYLIDLYAEPSGTWTVGGCNIAIEFNSDGLSADEYNDDDILNFDSQLSGANYSCSQTEFNSTYVIVNLFTLSPSVSKTTKFKIGTIKLKILDDSEYDDLEFYPDESEVANNLTQLTYGCSQSSCWDATDPTTQVIGGESGLSAPTLSSPSDEATDVSTSPTFSWSSVTGATNYDIQVSTVSNFSSTVVDANVTSTNKSVSGLNYSTTYYWRARAKNSSETSAWSSVWSFITESQALAAPTLSSPSDEATDVSTSPTLSWNSVTGATNYDIQISTVNDFSSTVVDDNVTTTSKSVSGLNNSTTYYWRVRAKNTSETSAWSSVWSFTTESGESLHFTFTTTNKLMTLKVPADAILKLGDNDLASGDEIGVFTQDDVCVGATEWNGSQVFFNVYGHTTTPPVDGLEEGEVMKYKFWDASENTEFDVSVAGHSDFQGNSINGEFDTSVPYKQIDSLIALLSVTQTLNFTSGWNLFSSYVIAPDPDMDVVMGDVASDLVIVRNDNAQMFLPNQFNSIGDWNNQDGYEGYFTSSTTLDIEGTKIVPEDEEISLGTGWSLVGYLRDSDLNIENAFGTINDNLVIARDGGSGIYLPGQYNSIGNMQPGQGYQVYLTSGDVLIYPANGSGKVGDYSHQITAKPEFLKLKEKGTGLSAVLFIEDINLPDGVEIGAFSENNELFGSGIVFNNQTVMVVHGDDPITDYKDGFNNQENIFIKIFDTENNMYSDIDFNDIESIEKIKFDKLQFIDKSIMIAKEGNINNNYFIDNTLNVSPNPVQNESKLMLNLKESSNVEIQIFSSNGQLINTFSKGILSRGIHEFELQFNDFSAGMYSIIVKLDNTVLSTNLIKIK